MLEYGMVCYAVVLDRMASHGVVWYGMVWYGMVWYGMVWYGMVWYGMVWYGYYGTVWNGIVCRTVRYTDIPKISVLNQYRYIDTEYSTILRISTSMRFYTEYVSFDTCSKQLRNDRFPF
jgi:hypothetical protein